MTDRYQNIRSEHNLEGSYATTNKVKHKQKTEFLHGGKTLLKIVA